MEALNLEPQIILKKLDDIPSLPAIVYELSRVINDPMSSTKEVEEIMAQDIGMTAKVLKLANSAYYAIPGGVSSLARAIAFIGFDTIHQLVLSASIIKALDTKGPSQFDVNEFWKHSLGVAIGAEAIGRHINIANTSDLFTCGLVHDMGKLALFISAQDTLIKISEQAQSEKVTFIEIERKHKLMTHAELGKLLAEKWQLPKSIQACALYHHEFDMSKRTLLSADLNRVVDIVSLSNLLVHALKFGNSGHTKILGAPNELLERLRINPQGDLPSIVKDIKAQIDKASDFIKMIGSTP
jgi:HD-like signal output (HDOD) protein